MILVFFEQTEFYVQINTQQPVETLCRNVMIHPNIVRSNALFVLEVTLASEGEDGVIFLALQSKTAKRGCQ